MIQAIYDYLPALFEKSCQHILLACLSTLTAITAGIPLGVVVAKQPKIRNLVIGTVNIFQTIPSIAMLAFLIPFLGIGIKPALVTLALYAVLPIVRNTYTGLDGVAPELIEAADGIGFTSSQKLLMVEFPIALPIIIAGIRIATVMSVGIATIAAFIGAGGLGDFIFQGISTDNTTLVLMGAVPAALLALVMDFTLGKVEVSLSPSNHVLNNKSKVKAALFSLAALFAVAGAAVYPSRDILWKPRNEIVVGSKDFTEQFILGEIAAQLLEQSGFQVKRKFNLGNTDICQRALMKGEIDLYPEYTGTGLLVVLKESYSPNTGPIQQFQYLNKEYQAQYQLKWLQPLGFSNIQQMTVTRDFAEQHNLETLSDLSKINEELVIAAPPEFFSREDAYPALKNGYALHFTEIKQMSPALVYPAIESGQVNVIMAFSTDARIKAYNLKPLKDDLRVFPPYQAAFVVRQKTLTTYPRAEAVLAKVSGQIDEDTMRRLNYRVEVGKKTPYQVAKSFLASKNLDDN